MHLSPRRNSASREESAPVGRCAWVDRASTTKEKRKEAEEVIVGWYGRGSGPSTGDGKEDDEERYETAI